MEFLKFGLKDVLDVLIVWFLIYQVLKLFRGTRATVIMLGITFLVLVALFAQFFNLEALNSIISSFQTLGLLALIIIFQPEIRRALATLGRHPWIRALFRSQEVYNIPEIASAAFQIKGRGLGAIFVIERTTPLDDYIQESGVPLDAEFTASLAVSIFLKNSPYHDGALVIRGTRIAGVRVLLPISQQPLPAQFGTRHRAAIGIVEQTDAISIVVSEERGEVRLIPDAHHLYLVHTKSELENALYQILKPKGEEAESEEEEGGTA